MTPQQAKEKLISKGITAKKFADDKGLNYRTVMAVLNGTNKGRHGEAHKAAVALGIKKEAA